MNNIQYDLFDRIQVHKRENNPISEEVLNENKDKLSRQCGIILELLRQGKRLTVREAMLDLGIGDLRRRICDLKENGYVIEKNWLRDSEGKRTVVEYFIK